MNTYRHVLRQMTESLARAGVPDPDRDALLLMAAYFDISTAQVSARLEDTMSDADESLLVGPQIYGRAKRMPMSHLLGYRDFYKSRFIVTKDVLDPRPETETLIELSLAEPFSEVLDLGTGSGAILLSLLKEVPQATGTGVDISPQALEVAGRNAKALGVDTRLYLERSDWCEAVGGVYDLIVSNPPYVSAVAYENLAPELYHEPKVALTPGGDGLAAYRIIARDAPAHLTPGGRLLVEIGFDQGRAVASLFETAGLEDVTVHPDINGTDRVVSARLSGN